MADHHPGEHPLARHARLDRRAFLQGAAALAAAGGAGAWLAACSGSDSAGAGGGTGRPSSASRISSKAWLSSAISLARDLGGGGTRPSRTCRA